MNVLVAAPLKTYLPTYDNTDFDLELNVNSPQQTLNPNYFFISKDENSKTNESLYCSTN